MPTDEEKLAAAEQLRQQRATAEQYNRRATQPLAPQTPDNNQKPSRFQNFLNDTANSLGGALMESAFRDFGDAFEGGGYTPYGQRPDTSYRDRWTAYGQQAATALQNRWYAAEYEHFKKDDLDPLRTNLEALTKEGSAMEKMLQNGRWVEPDGSIVELDYDNPKDVARAELYRAQLERDLAQQVSNAHITMNEKAAVRYPNNPIVADVLNKMMVQVAQVQASQFKGATSPMTLAEDVSKLESEKVNRRFNTAQARTMEDKLEHPEYDSLEDLLRSVSPTRAENLLRGKYAPLLEPYRQLALKEIQGREIALWRSKNNIPEEEWYLPETLAAQQEFLDNHNSEFEQEVLGWAMERIMGKDYRDAANQASAENPVGRGYNPPERKFKPAITDTVTKDEFKELKKPWEVVLLDAAERRLENEPALLESPEWKQDTLDWLKNEYVPHAVETGEDLLTGKRAPQLKDLTVDPEADYAKSYLAGVMNIINNYVAKKLRKPEGILDEGSRGPMGWRRGLFEARQRGPITTHEEAFPEEEEAKKTPRKYSYM